LTIFSIVLLLFGCAAESNPASPTASNQQAAPAAATASTSSAQGCAALTGFEQDKCYYVLAAEKMDISLCDKMSDGHSSQNFIVYDKYSCYGEVAAALKSLQICDKIVDAGDGFGLEEMRQCYAKVAIAKKDRTVCSGLKGDLDDAACISNVALAMKDATICNDMRSPQLKRLESCMTAVAIASSDKTICQALNDDGYKKMCLQQVDKGPAKNVVVCGSMSYLPTLKAQYCT